MEDTRHHFLGTSLDGVTLTEADLDHREHSWGWVAERYEVSGLLGRGGTGTVYAAQDRVLDRPVALKCIHATTPNSRLRVAREVAALRRLALPGVVRIYDDLTWEGRQWIVMERLLGTPFPGGERGWVWSELAPLTRQLLEVMGLVHQAGIVHRDLKPANVLVHEGRATLLDFGLARGVGLGSTITRTGAVLGTPRYLAPEQVYGMPADARADVYSLALMVYEALSGTLPFSGETGEALMQARLHVDPLPLPLGVGAPSEVRDTLLRCLSREPNRRPANAAALAEALGLGGVEVADLPFIGRGAELAALRLALVERRQMRVCGPPGAGASRLVEEVLTDSPLVLRARPGSRPFASVQELVAPPPADAGSAARWFVQALQARLDEGAVLVLDPIEQIDRWSRALVPQLAGLVWQVGGEQGDVVLGPLPAQALRVLFAGPDRLLHRCEDGAQLLHQASGGLPGDVARVVRAWTRQGLARFDSDGLLQAEPRSLSRVAPLVPVARGLESALAEMLAWVQLLGREASLERLSTVTGRPGWETELEVLALEEEGCLARDTPWRLLRRSEALTAWSHERRARAHLAVAATLAPGQRLAHLLAGHALEEAVSEAVVSAEQACTEGRYDDAVVEAVEVLAQLRALQPAMALRPLLSWLVEAAVLSRQAINRALARYELERQAFVEEDLLQLVVAGELAERGDPVEAATRLEALGELPELRLELLRRQLIVRSLGRRGDAHVDVLAEWLAGSQHWLTTHASEASVRCRWASWRGLEAYRHQDYKRAAVLHDEAAALAPRAGERMEAMLAAGAAYLEAGKLERSVALAEQVLAVAEPLRLPFLEARAVWLQRAARIRGGEPIPADLELLEALETLDVRTVRLQQQITESLAAFRLGEHEMAQWLAQRAAASASALSVDSLSVLARTIALAAGADGLDDLAGELVEAALLLPRRLAVECLALLRPLGVLDGPSLQAAQVLAHALTEEDLAVAGGVLSYREARAVLLAEDDRSAAG